MEKNLDILLTYIPNGPLSDQEAGRRLDIILGTVGNYKKVSLEIGNEPDIPSFWENSNLNTFAQFVNQTVRLVKERNSAVKFVIGAASQEEKVAPLIQALKRNNVNLGSVTLAVHAYNTIAEVDEKIDIINREAPGVPIMFTEIGANKSLDSKGVTTINMVNEARRRGATKTFIFQLGNTQFEGGNGNWGYADPASGERLKPFWDLVNWEWSQTHPTTTSSSSSATFVPQ